MGLLIQQINSASPSLEHSLRVPLEWVHWLSSSMLYAQKAAKDTTKSWETPKTAQKHKKTQVMVVQRNPQASTFLGHLRPLNWSTEISPQLVALIGCLVNFIKISWNKNTNFTYFDQVMTITTWSASFFACFCCGFIILEITTNRIIITNPLPLLKPPKLFTTYILLTSSRI